MIPQIEARLNELGIMPDKPAWKIIRNANLLPPLPGSNLPFPFGDSVLQALKKLMKSYHDYGRQNNWRWAISSNNRLKEGGLVKGERPPDAACGTFNLNFKWLAQEVLRIENDWSLGKETSHFLTRPNSQSIDSTWKGNVRTRMGTFDQLRCFKFSQHHWVIHAGLNYDACYNSIFRNQNDIIWTRLRAADPAFAQRCRLSEPGELFELWPPIGDRNYLKQEKREGPNGWPTFIMLNEAEL